MDFSKDDEFFVIAADHFMDIYRTFGGEDGEDGEDSESWEYYGFYI